MIASENAPAQVMDLSSGIKGDQLHHITWHAEHPHIRTNSKIIQDAVYPWRGLLTSGCLEPRPLLVESVCLKGSAELLRRFEAHKSWSGSTQQVILRQNSADDFSLIFILVPKTIPTADLFAGGRVSGNAGEKIPLWYLRAEQFSAGRIEAFSDWDLVVFSTPFPRRIDSIPTAFSIGYRLLDFVSPIDSLFAISQRARLAPIPTSTQVDALRCVSHQCIDQRISLTVLHALKDK